MATKKTSSEQGAPPEREPTPSVDAETGQPPVEAAESNGAGTSEPESSDAPGSAPAQPPADLEPAPYYVATVPIYHGGQGGAAVRAFNPGDRVPADAVAPAGWVAQSQVEHPSTAYSTPDPAPADDDDAAKAGQE